MKIELIHISRSVPRVLELTGSAALRLQRHRKIPMNIKMSLWPHALPPYLQIQSVQLTKLPQCV